MAGCRVVNAGGRRERTEVAVWERATGKLLKSYGRTTAGAEADIARTPDGRKPFVRTNAGRELHDWPAGQVGPWVRPAGWDERAGRVAAAWSPDGRRVAVADADGTVLVVPSRGPARPFDAAAAWADLGADDGGLAYRALWRCSTPGRRTCWPGPSRPGRPTRRRWPG